MNPLIVLALFAVTPDYDALVTDLAADEECATIAAKTLREAGVAAFPALVKRVTDKTVLENGLFQEEAGKVVDGKFELAKPRLGRAAFLIVQGEIEGAWPKGYRQYQILTEENVAQWLDAHEGATIEQMRIQALLESLQILNRKISADGLTPSHKSSLSFLHERLGKLLPPTRTRP